MTRLVDRAACLSLLLAACATGSESPKQAPVVDEELGEPGCVDCVLSDAQNYRYTAELAVDVQPGRSDGSPVLIDWSGLSEDVHGHVRGVDFDVEEALLLVFLELTPAEISASLASDQLRQSDVSLYATCSPTEDRCRLEDFGVLGGDQDLEQYYTEDRGTWMVLLRSSMEAGAHTMVFLPPRAEGASDVSIDDNTAQLDVEVDFRSAPALVADPGGGTVLDWSELGRDGLGNELDSYTLSRLILARYTEGPEALEQKVFDLERVAGELYEANISGRTSLTLDELAPALASQSLGADETWLLGLYCESCTNPAPKFVARVEWEPAADAEAVPTTR